ncbi:MAG: fumarylacetoacetate hydrolase family protein [Sphingomonas sp.]
MDRIDTASRLLQDLWCGRQRLPQLPEALRPQTEEEGYAIQARLEKLSGSPLFGWKIAATSLAGQAHIQVGNPLAGRLLQERILGAGESYELGDNLMGVAELEFAFRMGEDLPAQAEPYTPEEVVARVATLHPSIEIPDTRLSEFEKAGAPQLIADNACADRFKLGPASPEIWRSLDLAAHAVTGAINNGQKHHGIGRNVLGHPLVALTWLANRLSSLGLPLEAGQVVTTGTCLIPMTIRPGDHVLGDFGELGRVSLSIR